MSIHKFKRKKLFFYFSAFIIVFVMFSSSTSAITPLQQGKLETISQNKYTPLIKDGKQYNLNPYNGQFNDHYTSSNGANIQVNAPQQGYPNGLLGDSETAVTSIHHGQDIVVGWNDASGFCLFGGCNVTDTGVSGYGFSTNGGRTFTDGGAPPLVNSLVTLGDPWLTNDGGNIFYSSIAINASTGNYGISIWRGHFTYDGGFTFTNYQFIQSPANTATNPNFDFLDKESITMANDGSGAGYLTLTNFQGMCGQAQFGYGTIELWRTHNDGKTWTGPTVVSPDQSFIHDPTNPLCGIYGTVQQGSVSAIGPHGQVYVSWVAGPTYEGGVNSYTVSPVAKIMEATSFDGGRTFSAPVTVATINNAYYDAPVGYNRGTILDSPRISVATSGPYAGRVYVTYFAAVRPITNTNTSQQNLVSQQIFLKYSDNSGRTWKQAFVAPPPPTLGVKRFWPVVVTESNGAVDIVYYQSIETSVGATNVCSEPLDNGGTRTGPANSFVDVYWVHSSNGGAWFGPARLVTTVTSNWCSAAWNIFPNFGDYIGATASGNHVFAVWADGRNGVPDTFFANLQAPGFNFGHDYHQGFF